MMISSDDDKTTFMFYSGAGLLDKLSDHPFLNNFTPQSSGVAQYINSRYQHTISTNILCQPTDTNQKYCTRLKGALLSPNSRPCEIFRNTLFFPAG